MNNAVRFLFYGHGGSGNRGCEAILRSTARLLHDRIGDNFVLTVASTRKDEDLKAGIPFVNNYIDHFLPVKKFTFNWLRLNAYTSFFPGHLLTKKLLMTPVLNYLDKIDICFSIGGDNYCYETPHELYIINKRVKKLGKKLILWGCSIEPSKIDKMMEIDLKKHDAIIARESITAGALADHNIINNVILSPDPAFTLERQEVPLPANWEKGNTVGINVSPLILDYEGRPGITFKAVYKLVEFLLKESNYQIALIPHVTWEYTNDMKPLIALYNEFKESLRVILIGDNYSAAQLKYLISNCRLFIGARTHATIASYSSAVPTLVLGYSVKSIGIARDLFGNEKGLVLPVQELSDEHQIADAFGPFQEKETDLRNTLQSMMPEYISGIRKAVDHIADLIKK